MEYFACEQIRRIIDGKGIESRIPLTYDLWIDPAVFGQHEKTADALLKEYTGDVESLYLGMPGIFDAPNDDPHYRYLSKDKALAEGTAGLDAVIAIDDWTELPDILADFPSAEYPGLIPQAGPKSRYWLIHWWYWLFERLWSLRGMENALMDFYLYPGQIHQLFDKLTDFYCRVLERGKSELAADGLFISDDIGTQKGPFFSLDIFREFFKPYYKRLIDKAHALDMHVWMHTCGNIELFLPDLIEIGLDVIHPIQKYTMDEAEIAKKFGGQITFWVGFDVQQIIPYGTPQEVSQEVRHLVDTFARKDGRFMLTLGNGATPDFPIESLQALLKTSYEYGRKKAAEIR